MAAHFVTSPRPTNGYINAVIDNSRVYWRSVIDRLNQLRELMEQEVTGLDAGVYAEQRATLKDAIRIAEAELKSYSTGRIANEIQEIFETNIAAFQTSVLAAFGGLILVILAIAPAGPVIGAGALATATLAFVIGAPLGIIGGAFAIRYYRRVVKDTKTDLHNRIDELEKTYHEALNELTQKERNRRPNMAIRYSRPFYALKFWHNAMLPRVPRSGRTWYRLRPYETGLRRVDRYVAISASGGCNPAFTGRTPQYDYRLGS